ncbi:hypothetical protein BDW22DRAFT_4266 [Trametopsis cervina]|nr:hypothetical protein BDW22DRAFT_4266 [Trametopsis cervina]
MAVSLNSEELSVQMDLETPETSSGPASNTGQLRSLPSCVPVQPAYGLPVAQMPRTLVLCFDGTGDQFDTDNSNVIHFFSMLKKDDKSQQMVYYQAGIGTYTSPRFATPFAAMVSKGLDEMVAWNLHAHVMDGYEFLMQNYQSGDKICIFGFSRGAYTARALAGMVHKVGLLPTSNHQQVPFAYKMYSDTSAHGWTQSTAFKKAFCMDVDVEFVGVWDTVCSVGLIPKRLPFTTSNTCVRYFRHAISLDERRAKFKENAWHWPTETEKALGVQTGDMPKAGVDIQVDLDQKPQHVNDVSAKETQTGCHKNDDSRGSKYKWHRKSGRQEPDPDSSPVQNIMEQRFSRMEPQPEQETDVLEVWFAGCHCDVGGGSVSNDTRHNLARIPLRWMIRQCFLAKTGILFHAELLRSVGLDPAMLYPVVQARPTPICTTPTLRGATPHIKHPAWRMSTLRFPSPLKSLSTRSGLGKKLEKPGLGEKTERNLEKTDGLPGLHKLPPTSGSSGCVTSSASGIFVSETPSEKVLTEEEEDLADALSPVYDQLKLKKAWWLLEILPTRHRVQEEDNTWVNQLRMNLGRGRKIANQEKHGLYVHRTVKTRMEAHASQIAGSRGLKYTPQAKFDVEPTWVD